LEQYEEVKYDIDYILNQYFDKKPINGQIISRETKRKNQRRILSLLGIAYFKKSKHSGSLLEKACELSRISANPVFIFRELIEFVYRKKMAIPGYTTLQDIISGALSSEQRRIKHILANELSLKEVKELLHLIKKSDGFYGVTSLKKLPKNFKLKAAYQEISHFKNYSSIFQTAKRVLPCLGISNKSIAYYASLVDH
jgi:hypothetical protein